MFKVLPIPKSVASCLTTEEKAPRQERKWFEKVLKRVKKVFLRNIKNSKAPRLGFKCYKEDNPDFEEKIRQVQRKLRSLSYEADLELCQRYLPNELATQLPKSGLIGIKAPKGCGKSVLLKKIIALAKKQGIPVLSITPRIALGREQAIKWEVTWIDDYGVMQTRAGDTTRQIQELAQKRSEAKEN
jgi:superfamily II DNA or RNA helicase